MAVETGLSTAVPVEFNITKNYENVMQVVISNSSIFYHFSSLGVNINGVFLADLLLGETVSGIFYKDGKNLLIDPTFTPKFRQISNL